MLGSNWLILNLIEFYKKLLSSRYNIIIIVKLVLIIKLIMVFVQVPVIKYPWPVAVHWGTIYII